MKDQEIIQDALSSEQAMASSYLTATVSASSPLLQDTLSQLLSNTLQNVQLIGQEMQTYNWINPTFGSKADVDQLQFRYKLNVEQLEASLKQLKASKSH